jgi:hypothetical protein
VQEERQKLDEQISDAQAALAILHETARQKEEQHVKLTKQVADITGELLAVRNEQLEASNRMQQTMGHATRQNSHDSVSQSASGTGSANSLTSPEAFAASFTSLVPKHRPGLLPLYGNDRVSPRPLDTFQHFKPIFYTDIFDPRHPCCGGSMAAAEAFRHAQAAELECDVDDICLFPQMGIEVAPQVCYKLLHYLLLCQSALYPDAFFLCQSKYRFRMESS